MGTFKVSASDVTREVASLVKKANLCLPGDVISVLNKARKAETSPTGAAILDILAQNAAMARQSGVPICQDTGIDVVFLEIGQDLVIEGDLIAAVNEGVARGTKEGYLRSSVCDPITRKNSGDNTPAVVHASVVPGDTFTITLLPKGCGSENMSGLRMLPPSAGMDGIKDFVIECVKNAGPNPCPPGVIGVGIGGTMETAALLAKKALLRPLGQRNSHEELAELESDLLCSINKLGIGPQGLGGVITSLGVAVETFPCHIASLPVAVNIQCHAARRASARFENGTWIGDGDKVCDLVKGNSFKTGGIFRDATRLELPLRKDDVLRLKAGEWVLLNGSLLTGRDQTHRRLCQFIREGRKLPVDLHGQLIYYVGPTPAPPGHAVGAAGPTTSYRMDAYTPMILDQGVLGLMGKGKRSPRVRRAIKKYGAVYLATIGGAGAYLSDAVESATLVAFEDLGPEALFRFQVKDFPAIVINDSQGNDYYEMVMQQVP